MKIAKRLLNGTPSLPEELISIRRWLLWRFIGNVKIPYRLEGVRASVTNPQDWESFPVILEHFRRFTQYYGGLGFVLCRQDNIIGIDLDDSLEPAYRLKPWARDIVLTFPDCYWEVSPSGTGIKGFIRGKLPGPAIRTDGIELYDDKRFFCITGMRYAKAPLQLVAHDAEIDNLYKRSG